MGWSLCGGTRWKETGHSTADGNPFMNYLGNGFFGGESPLLHEMFDCCCWSSSTVLFAVVSIRRREHPLMPKPVFRVVWTTSNNELLTWDLKFPYQRKEGLTIVSGFLVNVIVDGNEGKEVQ